MLSKEVIEALAEILVERVEEANTYTLKQIAKTLKEIKDLPPTQAYRIGNVLKYGGDYDKITKKLAKMTELNVRDIDKIFKKVAKKNQNFAKQFYEYRKVKFKPYEENIALQRQVQAISNLTKEQYINFSNTYGFTRKVKGKIVYPSLSKAYQTTIDRAILSVSQGKSNFNQELVNIIKELSSSGLKVVDYASGYHRRLDTAVRMNLLDGLRQMTNEMNQEFGKEFGADGVEVDVHFFPAPDHAEVQGRQFTNEEFEKFQNDEDCVDVRGKSFPAEFKGHDRRSISQYNCYHNVFPIVVGVSKPIHSDEELQNIIDENEQGFVFEGKKYTLYEGTQLQRRLETEIRKAKDQQIMARQLGDGEEAKELIRESQYKITQLTKKYNKLVELSNLPSRKDRMRVSGYRRVSTK